jgi:hypothetical protein
VDPGLGNMRELEQLVLVRQAQLEPLRAEPEPEKRCDVYFRTVT